VTARGEDILAWLDTALAKAEQDAYRWHDTECEVHATSLIDLDVLRGATLCDCGGPEAVLRRCAADRKQLELHSPRNGDCRTCVEWSEAEYHHVPVPFPCDSFRALAEGYGWTEGER
jgi:hypothetical protein